MYEGENHEPVVGRWAVTVYKKKHLLASHTAATRGLYSHQLRGSVFTVLSFLSPRKSRPKHQQMASRLLGGAMASVAWIFLFFVNLSTPGTE